MTYGQVKREALRHIFSSEIAGVQIERTYNNQADYENRIPYLVYDAEEYIATTVKKIPAVIAISDMIKQEFDYFDIYTLPEDCFQMKSGGIRIPEKFGITSGALEYEIEGNMLRLPKNIPNSTIIQYFRHPMPLGENPSDNAPLDNTPDTHMAIPFYVGAHLVMYDDAFRYSALYNEFETRLQRIQPQMSVERHEIVDAYGGFGGSY